MGEALTHLPANAAIEDIHAQLRERGVVIVEGLLEPSLLARFNAELDPIVEATGDGRPLSSEVFEHFMGKHTTHFSGVAGRSRVFAEEVLPNPLLCGLADLVLLPHCVNYRLNVAHVLDRGPGSVDQLLHRDEDVWPHMPHPRPDMQVASVIALEDFTAENGATRVIPGSHRWDRQRRPEPDEAVAAVMPAGSAVVYLGSTLHGGGPNTTQDQRRRGMHFSFTLGWLRTEENTYLTTPIEWARSLPVRSQELLGYRVHDAIAVGGGTLGLVNTNDPIDLLASGEL